MQTPHINTPPIEELPDIVAALDKMFESRISIRPAKSVHPSAIGHPCERKLVYDQVIPSRESHGVYLQRIFELGSLLGRQAARDLSDALEGTGMEVVMQEEYLPNNPHGVSGRIDLSIAYNDGSKRWRLPVEVKSCSPFVFDAVRDLETLRSHPSIHVRGWYDQVQTYAELTGADVCLLLLRNKSSGQYRQIPILRDPEYGAALMAKADRIVASVAAYRAAQTDDDREAALPQRVPFAGATCGECEFRSVCLPDMKVAPGVEFLLWDTELEAYCMIREKNADAAKAWEAADTAIKKHGKAIAATMASGEKKTQLLDSGFIIEISKYKTSFYDVPPEVKAPYKKQSDAVRVSVKKLDVTEE